MISIRPVDPHEWPQYRDIRLRALRDAPDAFGSTWAVEAARADPDWAARLQAAAAGGRDRVLFAVNGEQACGLVWCKLCAPEPGVADLFQMWVDPAVRGRGAGKALLAQAIAWAWHKGMQRVRLGVTDADSPAMRLYLAHGFRPVGGLQPLREGCELRVQTMALDRARG